MNIKHMKKYLLLLSLFALNTMAQSMEPNLKWGKPTNEELTMTEYSLDKDAEAVELYHLTDVSYAYMNNDFRVYYRVKGRLKVLKPEGKSVADGSIVFRNDKDSNQRIEVVLGLKATAYNMENGKVTKTKMENSMIFEERLDKHQKRIKFSVPQVKVGTVIEYEYRIESDFYYDLRDWYAQKEIPVLYTKYVLSVPEWFSFNIEQTGSAHMEYQESNSNFTIGETAITTEDKTFIARNLPALKDDDFVWHAEDYGCKITHELGGIYVPGAIHKNYSQKWEDIDKALLEDEEFGGRIRKSSPLKDDIKAAGITDIADPTQRASAVWLLLKSRVRWNGDYDLWAKSASKVLKEGTGSNADINFLYINMLHDVGINAAPVVLRLRNRGRLPMTHASMKYLSTFVVVIQLNDSTTAYFDGSAEDGYLNVLPQALLVETARVVSKEGAGKWVNLLAMAQGSETTVVQANLDGEGTISGQRIVSTTGNTTALLRKKWRTAKDSVEVIRKIEEDDGITISKFSQIGRSDFSPNMREITEFTKKCESTGNLIYLNPLVFNPMKKHPFTNDTRDLPIEFPFKQRETLNIMLTLPDGWQVEDMPKPIVLKFDGITVRIVGSQNNNVLTMRYRMDIDTTFYRQDQYQDLKSFLDKVVESCKNMITLKNNS